MQRIGGRLAQVRRAIAVARPRQRSAAGRRRGVRKATRKSPIVLGADVKARGNMPTTQQAPAQTNSKYKWCEAKIPIWQDNELACWNAFSQRRRVTPSRVIALPKQRQPYPGLSHRVHRIGCLGRRSEAAKHGGAQSTDASALNKTQSTPAPPNMTPEMAHSGSPHAASSDALKTYATSCADCLDYVVRRLHRRNWHGLY